MKVLLIWDTMGLEPIKLWEVSGIAIDLVVRADKQYVNSMAESDEASRLSDILCDENGQIQQEYRSCFTELASTDGMAGPFDQIVVCGFIP